MKCKQPAAAALNGWPPRIRHDVGLPTMRTVRPADMRHHFRSMTFQRYPANQTPSLEPHAGTGPNQTSDADLFHEGC